jgi:hypothetical protein
MFLSRIRRNPVLERDPSRDAPAAAPAAAAQDGWAVPRPLLLPEAAHEQDRPLPPNARLALCQAFAPTRPQPDARRFVGREAQLARIRRALAEERAHVAVFGESGWGKTSLANMVAEAARAVGVMVARHACLAEDDYDGILRGLARSLHPSFLLDPTRADGADVEEGCGPALPPGRLGSRDVARLLRRLTGEELILIIDDFDRVRDDDTRTRLADTIKHTSDARIAASFVVVGVGDDADRLLGRHPSIQRHVVGVRVPARSEDEVEDILERGEAETGLAFSGPVRARIRAVARGVPCVAQLMALRAGQAALERGVQKVTTADFDAALASAIDETHPRVAELYEALVDGGRNRAMAALLRIIATSTQDAFGRFQVEAVADSLWVARVAWVIPAASDEASAGADRSFATSGLRIAAAARASGAASTCAAGSPGGLAERGSTDGGGTKAATAARTGEGIAGGAATGTRAGEGAVAGIAVATGGTGETGTGG